MAARRRSRASKKAASRPVKPKRRPGTKAARTPKAARSPPTTGAGPRPTERPRTKSLQRRDLLEAASRILVNEGTAALTIRRLARSIGASTMAVYTVFGGKDPLVQELYREGFHRLGNALEAVEPYADPLYRLAHLLAAYREMALGNPTWYALMYGQPIAGFTPREAKDVRLTRAYATVLDCVRTCIETGALPGTDAELIADVLWTGVHGHVSLELAGFFGGDADAEASFVESLRATVDGLGRG